MFRISLNLLFYMFCCCAAVQLGTKPKLVIDHDGGADDALAITMSLLSEAYFNGPQVVALTTTYGNVNQSQATINSFRILQLAGRTDVPIYAGAKNTLIHGMETDHFFGYDGLGDTGYVLNQPVKVENQAAAVGLVELAKKYEGHLIVMAIGPLTNIALATKLDPDFISRLYQLYIGAGHAYNDGNQLLPEFNANMDPEAYHVVAKSSSLERVTFVPMSQIRMTLNITKDWRKNVLGSIPTLMMQTLNFWERLSFAATTSWTLLDPAVAGIVLDNTIVAKFMSTSNDIVLCGAQRGITINNYLSETPNGKLLYTANIEKYKQLLLRLYSAEIYSKSPLQSTYFL